MSHPLFDTGYTLWAADLETQLKERHGQSPGSLGVAPRALRDAYYHGRSVTSVVQALERQYGLLLVG